MLCLVCSVNRTVAVCSVPCTICNVHCAVCNVQCLVWSLQYILLSKKKNCVHCLEYLVHCSVCSLHGYCNGVLGSYGVDCILPRNEEPPGEVILELWQS